MVAVGLPAATRPLGVVSLLKSLPVTLSVVLLLIVNTPERTSVVSVAVEPELSVRLLRLKMVSSLATRDAARD